MGRKRILVVGLGRFGTALAESLTKEGGDVVAVDREMESVESVKDKVGYAAALDATQAKALRSIEAERCAVAVIAMGESFESSVLCLLALKEVGVPRIVARARDARQAQVLRAIGADDVLQIEVEMGRRFAHNLLEGLAE